MTGKIESVPIWKLIVEDQKHRLKMDIESLAQSILIAGQINPITVQKQGSEYRVIAGRRRFAALTHIQDEITPDKEVKALVYVTDLNELQSELIKIDENIMRQQLTGAELDEAIYRRKQIYEELHPETKQGSAGAHAKHAKARGKAKPAQAFTHDAARKLGITKRTVERAVSRASKASDKVKAAREKGDLSPSKVDLLVTLPAHDQDLLLPLARKKDVKELRSVVDAAKRRGAKAVVLDQADTHEEDPRLKPLIRSVENLSEEIQSALENRLAFEGDMKHESLKALGELAKRIEKFTSYQRSALGYVKAIVKRGSEKRMIRGRG